MKKLDKNFYMQSTIDVAKQLLGKIIVHDYNGMSVSFRIIETEAYIGDIDKACHCYGGKITDRTKTMFMSGGYAYIYLIYGMYCCFNVVTETEGKGSAVLIRCAEPQSDIDCIYYNRYGKSYAELTKQQIKNMSNGPGKLCKALNICKLQNGLDLTGDELYISDDGYVDFDIETAKRVNIDYAEEAKDFMWRFILRKTEKNKQIK